MNNKKIIKNSLTFEIKSLIGGTFLNKKPTLLKDNNYLDIGCGYNVLEGYINTDFFKN